MVDTIEDSFKYYDSVFDEWKEEDCTRYRLYSYRIDDEKDIELMEKIDELIDGYYEHCQNCEHLKTEGAFCGYCAHYCEIHHDVVEPSKYNRCNDYKRIVK